jgi:general secretion pathway protein A
MYEQFYGLREKPFSLTPNPRYVYYSDRYRAALEHLLYGLEQREGFMLLTGPVGTGKTTLCRDLLEQLDPQRYRTALIFNPFLSAVEMLQALLNEYGVSYPADASKKELLDRLNRYLLARLVDGLTCVAIFDEAQHLTPEFLEQIRVLSNLETEDEKLVQIILVGQPELRDRIQQPNMAQLDQRVSVRTILANLGRPETERYIYHRINVAGAQGRVTFSRGALKRIYEASDGVPRLINLTCDRTLLAGYVAQSTRLGRREVDQGIASLRGEDGDGTEPVRLTSPRRSPWRVAAVVLLVVAAVLVGAAAAWYAGVIS